MTAALIAAIPSARLVALGEPLYRIRSCEGLKTANLAYGGADLRDLYITEADAGSILCARLPTPAICCSRIAETGTNLTYPVYTHTH